ncbi:SDR family NAD(P)-dependent oxidoreductase [Hymenobacter latericus]|uniref:SDR family NAD(P)-dependent oxidoreductase n=1 Tax=Hymenobacter sp. YIM 151858-1 TaxID=2987688 RepID=UPI002228040E|nr:SDR family NAD(P)-dependent oxidoreductase [Hymenobacter sp. YIM 151858-1]UYZ59931.1 SDR family NAD(P)-dependent oxidoreductase [Hymenobacter sp. YIM 151858-1]
MPTTTAKRPLHGRTILLTGASAGIGLAAAKLLAALGAHLLLVCRNQARGQQALAEVQAAAAPNTPAPELLLCDLAILAEVHQLCDEILDRYPKLDVLINNAGVLPDKLIATDEGHELCWVTNHLAPFVITNRLLPLLEQAGAGARIITVASEAHWLGEIESTIEARIDPNRSSAFTAYCDSKLANILFTKALAERLELTPITAHCLHPGLVRSNLWLHSSWLMRAMVLLALPFARSNEKAAETIVCLVTETDPMKFNGAYLKNCHPARVSSKAASRAEAFRLWRISADETGVGE